jgi:hypothetical protein
MNSTLHRVQNSARLRCLGYCQLATALIIAVSLANSVVAQSGRYYLTDESGFNRVWQFQGGSLIASFPTVPAGAPDGPILVDGNALEVRSVKGGFSGGAFGGTPVAGSEYDFNGVVQGPLSLDFTAHANYGRVIDGAFDGQNAYIVAGLGASSGVFRYNGDFSGSGTLMFNIPTFPQSTAQGITYDTLTNTIWTSDYDFGAVATGGRVRQWSLAGVELFSFPVADNAGTASERNTALAYDPSDDTFWMNAHVETSMGFGFGELWQFDRSGSFLQKIHGQQSVPNAPSLLYWGGEIFIAPEPSSLALLGGCVLVGAFRRRK